MIDANFEFITSLQYKVKELTARVTAFESGEKYLKMRSEYRRRLSKKDCEIRRLNHELAVANRQVITSRENWMQVFEDINKEHEKEMRNKDREIEKLQKQLLSTRDKLTIEHDKFLDKNKELYRVLTELEEEKGRNQVLKAQLNRDFENSSIPSSMKPNPKKIVANSRVKTDRKPGGQPGHEGHGRKRGVPTNTIHIPAPKEYLENPNYRPTGKTIIKQMINLHVNVVVDEYHTPEFRNVHTGQRVYADFPDGVVNDVNYGGSVKAFAFLLNSRCCVSIDKVREFLSELTDGELQISKGMISGLCKKFSGKTETERKSIFSDILLSPVMNTDFTTARLNGKNVQVIVCATQERTLYFLREHKGHEGVKGTPVETYQNTMVHDHDKTFYNYGGAHQECLSHPIRYLKDSMDNEASLEWNGQMRELIQEMIHYRKSMDPDDDFDTEKVDGYEARYHEILAIAQTEYEYEPPTKYYRDGYNLYRRLDEYCDNHLLFLHDRRIPWSNNLSERLLRIIKRKQKQAMTFRSFDSLSYLCECMSIIETFRLQGINLYRSITSIF